MADRKIVYAGQIPLTADLLDTNRFSMIGLAKLAAAMLGTTTQANGFAATPTSPASMQVSVAPGEVYALANVDATAYGSLAADTAHSIVKQGIALDATTLTFTAPATAGQSIAYLIQVAYQDVDAVPVALPYYNASNPAQAFTGPGNSGAAQNTVRRGAAVLSVKAGIAAATGSQVAPAPDAGNVGLWVVTVANGATTITAGNIAASATAPFLSPAVRSAQFTGTNQSLDQSGFQRFPGGLILQWGAGAADANGNATIFFPLAFPTQVFMGIASDTSSAVFDNVGNVYYAGEFALTNMKVKRSAVAGGDNFVWMALGK